MKSNILYVLVVALVISNLYFWRVDVSPCVTEAVGDVITVQPISEFGIEEMKKAQEILAQNGYEEIVARAKDRLYDDICSVDCGLIPDEYQDRNYRGHLIVTIDRLKALHDTVFPGH